MLPKNSNVTLGDFISLTASLFDSLAQLDRKSHLLVDRCGKMVASSSCGAAILADGRFLRLQDGHLLTCRNAHRKAFQMLLMVPGGKVETAALRSEPDDDLLVVRAVAFDETLLCLSLTSSNGAKEYNLPDLGKLFGLTPSEAGIVCDLYHGRTPRWIAEYHSNSIHTIRAHIRHCYDKMGVSCREELWSLLNDHRTH